MEKTSRVDGEQPREGDPRKTDESVVDMVAFDRSILERSAAVEVLQSPSPFAALADEAERRAQVPEQSDFRAQLHRRIDSDFTYHAPRPEQLPVYHEIREGARILAHNLVDLCPQGRELSTALTHLEQVVFNANAAVARHG